jgi:cell division septal protein FtsQ
MKDSMGGSLKFEAEFFRKNNNLTVAHDKKIHSIQVRTVHILLLLTLTLLSALTVYKAVNFLLTCDALQVHSFRLRNQPVFAKERIAGILRRCGGNILTLDLEALQARLLQVPEIENVSIRRILPDTVEIAFRLRQPFYQQYANGMYRLLDADGICLGEQRHMPSGLVDVRGGSSAVSAVAVFSPELRPLREKIEYVAYNEPYGLEVKLRDVPEIFYPGDNHFVSKINRYFKIKSRLPLNVAAIRSVDLRIAGRIYFEYLDEQRGDS